MSQVLLPETVRRRLDPLRLMARKIRMGAMKGERRSLRRGSSIEFADYRNYVPGDDLRRLDWNVYARSEKPTVKLLEDEEDLTVHLLLDSSASMDWPRPDDAPVDDDAALASDPNWHKYLYARRVTAGLAYMAMIQGDRLHITALSDSGTALYGPARGKSQTVPMLRFLHDLKPAGVADLNHELRDVALRSSRAGLIFILTDLFSPSGYLDGLNLLLSKGHEVVMVHVLSPDEIVPPLAGDLRLIDVETGRAQEVSIDVNLREAYQQRFAAWQRDIRAELSRRGVPYLLAQTDAPWEQLILYAMRRIGLVK